MVMLFYVLKGQREHVSIIGKALKPPKISNTLGRLSYYSEKFAINY